MLMNRFKVTLICVGRNDSSFTHSFIHSFSHSNEMIFPCGKYYNSIIIFIIQL